MELGTVWVESFPIRLKNRSNEKPAVRGSISQQPTRIMVGLLLVWGGGVSVCFTNRLESGTDWPPEQGVSMYCKSYWPREYQLMFCESGKLVPKMMSYFFLGLNPAGYELDMYYFLTREGGVVSGVRGKSL